MRARYARLLAARYKAVSESDSVDLTYLYQCIYPGIMRQVQLGKTELLIKYKLKESVEKVLVSDGFHVRDGGVLTTIDWSFNER